MPILLFIDEASFVFEVSGPKWIDTFLTHTLSVTLTTQDLVKFFHLDGLLFLRKFVLDFGGSTLYL